MDWLEAAFGFGDEPEPAAKPVEPPRQAPKVQSCCVVIAQPAHEGDLGEVIDCWWYEQDGAVVLCSQSGKPTGDEKRLMPGDNPLLVARRLRLVAYRSERPAESVKGFGAGRRLHYGPLGQA
jgi:hypothetical protein